MEEWKDVPGYDGKYQVSSTGLIRITDSVPETKRSFNRRCGGRILVSVPTKLGYYRLHLSNPITHKRTNYNVHRLVAEAFVPNPENKPEVNHKDGDKRNNNASNLEWCTRSENEKHAFDNNLAHSKQGADSVDACLTNAEVTYIRNSIRNGTETCASLSRKFNVAHPIISNASRGRTYKNNKTPVVQGRIRNNHV